MFNKKIITFDIGATKILKAVVILRGDEYRFLEIEEQKNPRKEEKIKNILLTYCQYARKKYWTKKVAISAAYIVDQEKRAANQGRYCYGVDYFNFQFLRNNKFLVQIENDGRCFALGEYCFGRGKDASSVFSMTLGTNIGGGFIHNGNNFRGQHNSAMEISYLKIFCDNKWRSWDDFCAGRGIENAYRRKTGKKKKAKEIFAEAERNGQVAKDVVSEAANILGAGIASLLNILDPELIIFGGSLSKQKKFIDRAIETARKNVFNKKANYKFAISALGNKANLLGAASLYLK